MSTKNTRLTGLGKNPGLRDDRLVIAATDVAKTIVLFLNTPFRITSFSRRFGTTCCPDLFKFQVNKVQMNVKMIWRRSEQTFCRAMCNNPDECHFISVGY
jgi:hypothetical protein